CHNSTNNWLNVTFSHTNVAGTCSNCHNGTFATGKSANHLPTNAQCDDCHTSTSNWLSVTFDHSGVTGSCNSCHNGTIATGTPQGHFVTTQQCDVCHTTNGWLPVLNYRHTSGNYPGDHRVGLTCLDCHTTNSESVPWPFPSYARTCAGCHANDYENDEDDHSGLSADRNCGSSGCHSVNSREW
ncbi:MAG: cytochrome c3 family protein, partial [Candidatus Thiodiazotropha taylori]|nr:cytochrome c3 family protein [Candidatus Thiodiazotropha taylori]MCG7973068.1 cytochrome c3 family protein [Candidatus Thiodiazotropha taylori]